MSFWGELRRRNVVKVAAAYVIGAWVIAQVASVFAPALALPSWVTRFVVFLLVLGLPVALILAWVFEFTPEGIKKTREVTPENSIAQATGRKLNYAVTALLALAVVVLLLDNYFFTGGSAESAAAAPAASAEGPATATATRPNSIAVLPFENLSSDPEQEAFADGLSEQLISELARIEGLDVRARTSSFYFKGKNETLRAIGEALAVEHLLEGSVRRAGDDLRITAQLIDARTDSHRWSREYDRKLDDIFAIQEDIARSVAETLQVTLGVGEIGQRQGMTRNVQAYEEFLKARALIYSVGAANNRQIVDYLQRAIGIDPNYAIAHADLAFSYSVGIATAPEQAEERSAAAALSVARARELAPESPYVRGTAAWLAAGRGDWLAAGREYAASRAAGPSREPAFVAGYGNFLVAVGRSAEAIAELERAKALDPFNVETAQNLAVAYESLGDIEAAIAEEDRGLALDVPLALLPGSSLTTALASGRRELIEQRVALSLERGFVERRAIDAAMVQFLDDSAGSRAELERFLAISGPLELGALTHWAAYYGHPDLALQAMQRTSLETDTWRIGFRIWRQGWRDVRRLPGFKDLVRDMGLVPYWREFGWSDFCRPVGADDFECR